MVIFISFSSLTLISKGMKKAGIKAAQMIREVNPFAIIAFITTKSEFATITYRYKVSALDLLKKP